MIRRLLSRPFVLLLLLPLLLALTPVAAYAKVDQPLGIDWTPIVFWAIVLAVILGGFLLGVLIDWGNR